MATVTAITSVGSVNLNDRTNYFLLDFTLGPAIRDEEILLPWGSPIPIFAARQDRPRKLNVKLRVHSTTSMTDLVSKVEAIRTEFNQDNTIVYNRGGASSKTLVCYKSAIDPVNIGPLTQQHNSFDSPWEVIWSFQVWTHPYYSGETVPAVI